MQVANYSDDTTPYIYGENIVCDKVIGTVSNVVTRTNVTYYLVQMKRCK